MKAGFSALVVYVLTTVYLAYTSVLGLNYLEVVLNLLKALFNTIVAFHGFKLYQATEGARADLV